MVGQRNTGVWRVSNPSIWPKAPRWMSFSTLLELETCPRRWALTAADYPHIWEHHGYPPRPQISALDGTVVHLALQKITHALAKHGCTSLREVRSYSVLKDLGGYTFLISECIDSALRPYERNPRSIPFFNATHQRLIAHIPEFRIHIQRLLSRIKLVSRDGVLLKLPHLRINESRHQILHGSYTEVELQVPELGWCGIIDLLTITSEICEIRDFKTGVPKPHHELQIRIYALLWALDHNLNPSGRLAEKLVLSYDENDVEIPIPRDDELLFLEDEIKRRTEMVIADLQFSPPDARPSQENCSYCSVRQLCEEYWKWHIQHKKCSTILDSQFIDLQIKLAARHGPTSWDGIVESSSIINVGQSILLRTSNVPFELQSGQRVRIINIRVDESMDERIVDEPTQVIATMGINTEVFVV